MFIKRFIQPMKKGDATILNELYEIMPSGDERQTSLLVLEETKFLEPLIYI